MTGLYIYLYKTQLSVKEEESISLLRFLQIFILQCTQNCLKLLSWGGCMWFNYHFQEAFCHGVLLLQNKLRTCYTPATRKEECYLEIQWQAWLWFLLWHFPVLINWSLSSLRSFCLRWADVFLYTCLKKLSIKCKHFYWEKCRSHANHLIKNFYCAPCLEK